MIHLVLVISLNGLVSAPVGDDPSALDPVAGRLAAARLAYADGELGLAHDHLRAALADAPGEPSVRLWLGRVLNDLGRGADAATVLTPALAANDGSAWLWAETGRAHRIAGRTPEAERAFRAALERNRRFGVPRLELAELLVGSERAAEAERVLAPLLDEARDELPVVLAHAEVLHALGRGDEAEARWRGAIDHPASRLALARHLAATDRVDEAWVVAEPLAARTGDSLTLLFLGQIARDAGARVEALALLGTVLLDTPTHPVALGSLNELLEHDLHALRSGLTERWVAACPRDAGAWRELVETDVDRGDLDAALLRLAAVPGEVRASEPLRLLEGEVLRRAGRVQEARAVLEALTGPGGPPRAWYELGLLEYATGDPSSAAEAFERGADGPWAADAHFNRGVCLDRLRRWSDAADAYRAATEARPNFEEAWYQLGTNLRLRLGDAEGAARAYRRYLELGGDDPEVRRFVEGPR